MEEKNFKVTISFDGSSFYGWQKQKNKPTICGEIEKAVKKLFNQNVKVIGCGRTDAKVHGINYVANFKVKTLLTTDNIKNGLNFYLPETIRIKKPKEVKKTIYL